MCLNNTNYSDAIWCDVIPITVTHILFECSWLYHQGVMYDGEENTYSFDFNKKLIILKPLSAELM
jgi:hypothetical protein